MYTYTQKFRNLESRNLQWDFFLVPLCPLKCLLISTIVNTVVKLHSLLLSSSYISYNSSYPEQGASLHGLCVLVTLKVSVLVVWKKCQMVIIIVINPSMMRPSQRGRENPPAIMRLWTAKTLLHHNTLWFHLSVRGGEEEASFSHPIISRSLESEFWLTKSSVIVAQVFNMEVKFTNQKQNSDHNITHIGYWVHWGAARLGFHLSST